MEKFTHLTAIAAPLPLINCDTDKIFPAQHMTTVTRKGLGRSLFNRYRYRPDGSENPDFVLNRPDYRAARIIVAYDNFGCGSSREHAPWALLDFGIRCVIAPSFGDIFYNNCTKNGILPLRLPQDQVDILMADAQNPATSTLTVDLENQTVARSNGERIAFEIDPFRRETLLNGMDDVNRTLQELGAIESFERRYEAEHPWI